MYTVLTGESHAENETYQKALSGNFWISDPVIADGGVSFDDDVTLIQTCQNNLEDAKTDPKLPS